MSVTLERKSLGEFELRLIRRGCPGESGRRGQWDGWEREAGLMEVGYGR